MSVKSRILMALLALPLAFSCQEEVEPITTAYSRNAFLNYFAKTMTERYYLWVDEVEDQLDSWTSEEDPKAKVLQMRYKDESGKDIDRWTVMTDDLKSFISSVSGVTTTYGYNLGFYYTDSTCRDVDAIIKYVYKDSPSQKAGLKRGDRIIKVNGTRLTAENYQSLANDLYYSASCTLGMKDGRELSLTAVEMYSDPFLLYKVFEGAGKKLGYLCYMSFSLKSMSDIEKVTDFFLDAGISELILDLRYNGGGYVSTEEALASVFAPYANVSAGDVFQTMVYNSNLSGLSEERHFQTSFTYTGDGGSRISVSTAGQNLHLNKIYVIMTGATASASEGLITGLKPYMDIDVIGRNSYGKYCSGYILSATDFYEARKYYMSYDDYRGAIAYTDNWGMYIMFGRFGDRNGDCPCMPFGFTPDATVDDNPADGYQLGDEGETMLSLALGRAGISAGTKASLPAPAPEQLPFDTPAFSILQTP